MTHLDEKAADAGEHSSNSGNEEIEYASAEESVTASWGVLQWMAIVSLAFIYVGSQLPLYFAGGALSFIAADIGSADSISWIPVSYQLGVAALSPFVGYLEDGIGKRNIVLIGCVFCCVGIIVVATAQSFGPAVAGMAITGPGAAITELTALAGIAELLPVAKRGYGHALITAGIIPFTPYVMYSQLLSTYVTWRWTFWICLIVCGLATVGAAISYWPKSVQHHSVSRKDTLKKMDLIGGFLSITGITIFLVALQASGYSHPWRSAYILCQLIIGLLLIVAFVIWEWKGAKHPMIPGALFKGQNVVAGCFVISWVAGMNFYSLLNFYPLTFSEVYNPAPVQVGLKGLGYGMSVTIGATLGAWFFSIVRGHNREILTFGAVLMTAFGGALAALTPETPKMSAAFGTIGGFGVGIVLVPTATVAACAVPDDLIATCIALVLTLRFVGGAVGYTVYNVIFNDKLTAALPLTVAQYAVQAGLPQADAETFVSTMLTDPAAAAGLPGVTPEIVDAATLGSRWAYADSLAYVWYTSIPFGIITIFICIFMPDVRRFMTSRVAARIERSHA